MNAPPDNDISLKLLQLLKENPQISQREMNQAMGVSIGKVNYCVSALSEKGMIKIERFKKAYNKRAFMYRLTPKGLEELGHLTLAYLKQKINEYSRIKEEIKFVYDQVDKNTMDLSYDPELLADLEKILLNERLL